MVMENWRPWFWGHVEKHYVVKVTLLRLEFGATMVGAFDEDIIALQITGTATKKGKLSSSSSSFSSSNCSLKLGSTHTTLTPRAINSKAPTLLWDARDLSAFHLVLNNGTLHMIFLVLHVRFSFLQCNSYVI